MDVVNEVFHRLSFLLCTAIKLRSIIYNVVTFYKVSVKLANNDGIFLRVFFANDRRISSTLSPME